MSSPDPTAAPVPANAPRSFVAHARVIGAITLVSRVLGLVRERMLAQEFGQSPLLTAFKYAFVMPNLFRKLLGEGALAAAFVPLYTRAVRGRDPDGTPHDEFAAGAVALQLVALLGITVVGELALAATLFGVALRPETALAVKLSMLMLPYVVFVCAAALLGGILQVHHRFVAATATAVLLNVVLIASLAWTVRIYDAATEAGGRAIVWWQGVSLLVAGALQVAILAPSLRACGLRLRPPRTLWSAGNRAVLRKTIPVALGLGVLQLGVVLDKQISLMMAPQSDGATVGHFLGLSYALPMAQGAMNRLDLAQTLYQFPLGVFGVAIATAIFPKLSGDALHDDLTAFRDALSRGIRSSLFIGLPASAGMVLVATPLVRLVFEGKAFTPGQTQLTALSTAIYSSVIWAFSAQQILNRGYYALHDMRTPLVWGVLNLVINLVVEIPLLWTLGESAMAVGTVASFCVQTSFMTFDLCRRVGLPIGEVLGPAARMLAATLAMSAACLLVRLPRWPTTHLGSAGELLATVCVGAGVYFAACVALGLPVKHLIPKRGPKSNPTPAAAR